MNKPMNKLINETSPYLKQHAHNPVDWYPWGEEALEKARKENKPILLSIGYAACHWCHVMAHESFEDNETAELMNQLFINIKVDREERPDLDKIYQTTHYLLTQQPGGWPLTVFLTPEDLTPFFSGTYFPREDKYEIPSFKQVLKKLSEIYQKNPQVIQLQNTELLKILHPIKPKRLHDVSLTLEPLELADQQLNRSYDKVYGGFGHAPKFPQPTRLHFLIQNDSIMAKETLTHIAEGGIYDQLGGGFFRYSVDEKWRIPHFEKMLYDNAQLLSLYTLAFKQYNEIMYASVIRDTANWIMNNMQAESGGYFSSMDADSEGVEGKYYVFAKNEVASLLTKDEFAIIEKYYGLNHPANFEKDWHFYLAVSPSSLDENSQKLLASAKLKLLAAREKRVPPDIDTKILTAWNALMIKAMLTSGRWLNEPKYIESAYEALSYIQKHHWINKRLLATDTLPAYLDDYAFLMDALITALQVTWNKQHLVFAIEIAENLLNDFSDPQGGFYFTANDHEKLLYRPKTMMDEVIPAGNSIAAKSLLVLGHLLGETRYIDAAEKTLHAGWPMMTQFSADHCSMLEALKEYLKPSRIIVIRGSQDEINDWQATCQTISNYVFAIPDDEIELPGLLSLKESRTETVAYICQGLQCLDVVTEKKNLLLS